MEAPLETPPFAWQPLTPKGVAAFAGATLGRLLLVQLIFALAAGFVVAWFMNRDWFPVISQAVDALPDKGEIRRGQLYWSGPSPLRLADGRFLALVVDLRHEGEGRSPAHLLVEFGEKDFKVFSLFGYVESRYPTEWDYAFNREELKPTWGAWAPAVLAIAVLGVAAGLMVTWACLATIYCLPVWIIGFYANRSLGLGGSWRVAGAALLPGALFMSGAIVVYGLGGYDLVRLLVAVALHMAIGWGYCVAGTLAVPRCPGVPRLKDNPFKSRSAAAPGKAPDAAPAKKD